MKVATTGLLVGSMTAALASSAIPAMAGTQTEAYNLGSVTVVDYGVTRVYYQCFGPSSFSSGYPWLEAEVNGVWTPLVQGQIDPPNGIAAPAGSCSDPTWPTVMYFNWLVQTSGTPSGKPFVNNLLMRFGYADEKGTYTKGYIKYAKSYRCNKPLKGRSVRVTKTFNPSGALHPVFVRKWVVRCKSGGIRSVRRVPFRATVTFESVVPGRKGSSFYKVIWI